MPAPHGVITAHCAETERDDDHQQQEERRELYVVPFNFLAEVFRRPSDHQAGQKDRHEDENQHGVKPASDAAKSNFTQMHVEHQDEAGHWRKRIVLTVVRAFGGGRYLAGPGG